MLVYIFTHGAGYIESFDSQELQDNVSQLGLVGAYSTREVDVINNESVAPVTVTVLQAKAALTIAGLYDAVDAYMKLDETDRLTKLKWQYSNFKRDDPSVLAIGAELGMTSEDLDNLFALAQTIS